MRSARPVFFILGCLVLFAAGSCLRPRLELEDAPAGPSAAPLPEDAQGPLVLPSVQSPKTEEEKISSLQVDGKRFDFFDLSIPPSFSWTQDEYRLFSFLTRVVYVWEQVSYRSPEERDAAFFFHAVLLAFLSGEDVPENRFRVLADYALPLYLYKRIPPRHKPALSPEELERLAQFLWDRGYNLNHLRKEDLLAYLQVLRDVAWKEHVFSPEDPWPAFSALFREEGLQLAREDLAAVRRCLPSGRKPEGGMCVIGRYQLQWKASGEGQQLVLTASLETGRGRDLLQSMLAAYQKRPGWFSPGMQFPVPMPHDEFILAATGPLALTIAPQEPPGNPDWPQNLRQTDWENVSGPWLEILGKDAPDAAFRQCAPGILDALAAFLRYTHGVQGKPSERLSSRQLSPHAADAAVMERLWSYVWFLHAASTGHHVSLGIRSGCEGHVLTFLALRAAWLISASDDAGKPDEEILALRLLFGLLHHFRTAGKTDSSPSGEPPRPVQADILSAGDFPERRSPEKLPPFLEASWVLLSQPENFLLTLAPRLLGISLLPQRDRLRERIRQFSAYRVHLPALPRLAEEHISYRRAKDALDYYLQLTSESRRLKRP